VELVLVLLLAVVVLGSLAAVATSRRGRDRTLGEGTGVTTRPAPSAPAVTRPPEAPRPVLPDRPSAPVTAEELAQPEAQLTPETAPPVAEAIPEAAVAPEPVPVVPVEKPRLRDRLGQARSVLAGAVGSVLSRSTIDAETWDELEEALIRADVGVGLTSSLLDDLRTRVKSEAIGTPEQLVAALKADLKTRLSEGDRTLRLGTSPSVWLFVGVNGVGKTTSIGKVGLRQATDGKRVVMAAADTFRAAAGDQLELWAKRVGADIVRGREGGDPGSVIFDAVERAKARGVDLVLGDTAGRLHTKVNLMEELKKVRRVAEKEPGDLTEVLLVIDATTGQNGLAQAREFTDAVGVTGVVLTKLDGSAKGGIALAIQTELGIPIKLVGVGETAEDLVDFDPEEYVEGLFG
jgi:fused signal recognition particle receptor